MRYKTPQALDMAVKAAAKASPMDTNRAITNFYHHRLLCRIFRDPESGFILKGGQGMLARTIGARATRDIDLLSERNSIDDALNALKAAAAIDLGDYIHFIFETATTIKAGDEYRSGWNVAFTPWLGAKPQPRISIDLVVDEIPMNAVERVTPADRLDIDGLEVCDYLVYPVENALADKLCAIIERHQGRASTRVKDLVDIIVYATTSDADGFTLSRQIRREAAARRLALPSAFEIPAEWRDGYRAVFTRLCAQTAIPRELHSLDEATRLAMRFLGPALAGEADGRLWSHTELQWSGGAATFMNDAKGTAE